MEKDNFFTKPIAAHPFTDEFAAMCVQLDFRNLQDILACPFSQLLKLNGFTYHHYHELWKYMDENGCLNRINATTVCQE